MDFKERFKGRTTTMDKDGVIGIVTSSGVPIDKTAGFNDRQGMSYKIKSNDNTKLNSSNSKNTQIGNGNMNTNEDGYYQQKISTKPLNNNNVNNRYQSQPPNKSKNIDMYNNDNKAINTNNNNNPYLVNNPYTTYESENDGPTPMHNKDRDKYPIYNNNANNFKSYNSIQGLGNNDNNSRLPSYSNDNIFKYKNKGQQIEYLQSENYNDNNYGYKDKKTNNNNTNGVFFSPNNNYKNSQEDNYFTKKDNKNINRFSGSDLNNANPMPNTNNGVIWLEKNPKMPEYTKPRYQEDPNLERSLSANIGQLKSDSPDFYNGTKKGYRPYTLKEYKETKDLQYKALTQMGGLGPNIGTEEWTKRKEKLDKMSEFSMNVKLVNMQSEQKLPPSHLRKPKDDASKSKREKALEFAKNIPKPKLRNQGTEDIPIIYEKEEIMESALDKYERQHANYLNQLEKMKINSN